MDTLQNLLLGLQECIQPMNLLYCFVGVFIGTLIGVLPGIGSVGTMAILFPVTFNAPPLGAIIMLAGIYYGSMYGGSTTSILVNIPGEMASVMTCLDGYQMALQGRAGPALGISAFGSFFAGTLGLVCLMFLAPALTTVALAFGPPEFFSLMTLGLMILIYIAQKSLTKALISGGIGLMLSYVGLDIVTGTERFSFGFPEFIDGIGIAPIAMGLFGIAEVLQNLERTVEGTLLKTKIKGLLPTLQDWSDSFFSILRGAVMGFCLGILPGGGASLSTYVSYAVEKKVSRHPEKFGSGVIQGVAGPEAANNAASSGAFVPLMTLGIPSNAVMAMLFAGLLVHGITPGPLMLQQRPEIFWGLIASMYIGNLMLLVLNLPLIGMWVKVTRVPFRILFPLIVLLCIVGVYSIDSSILDLRVMMFFGVIGYLMRRCGYEAPPLILAYVLGPGMEQALRQSLILSNGDFTIFLVRPISAVCLGVAALLIILAVIPKKKRLVMQDKM